MPFKEISIDELNFNPITMFGNQWPLLSAGNEAGYNTMTISWGHIGSIWGRRGNKAHAGIATASVYVRPQRYTKEFIDQEERFTISVFSDDYKRQMSYLGRVSGREEDKIATSGLTPHFQDGTVMFKEAEMVFVCRKIYQAPLVEAGFLDTKILDDNYPERDLHDQYIGEIVKVYVKQ